MTHLFDSRQFAKLDNPRRRELLPVDKILDLLRVEKGSYLADLGCGIGYVSIPAAEKVGPEGHLFALDLQEQMIIEGRRRSQTAGLRNIAWILNPEDSLPLPASSVDAVIMVAVFHELENRSGYVEEAHRILRAGGRLGIVDWKPGFMEIGPPQDHRVAPVEVEALLAQGHFRDLNTTDISEGYYMTVGQKRNPL
ncbi:class I SAM-dependent methyltransferase [Heliobacterium mobile]|uniref:class I SAM-dependent methyltransferase n=1 Tax=Heliobacterium mobile TaxID=28064 RepID=UPI001478A1E1|nr:methyltransferase domain-containing protein [Heliobacterium mobile]